MQYIIVLFEDPITGSHKQFSQKCHTLDSDLNKFLIGQIGEGEQIEFLSKNKLFCAEDQFNELMFDNRVALYSDTYTAELAINKLKNNAQKYIYQVTTKKEQPDAIILSIVKKL